MNKTHNKEEQPSLLQELKIQGLNNNPALDHSLQLLVLGQRLSKISYLDEEKISQIREQMANEIVSLTTTLATLKIYDEIDIARLKFCLCVFLDGLLMQNEVFLQSSYVNNTLTLRYFKELSDGKKFFSIMDKWLENPLKNKDMLEVIYACLLLGYKGHFAVDKKHEEQIAFLCENIASSITPTLNTNDMVAFEYAYRNQENQTFWQKYLSVFTKILLFVVPVVSILCIYLFEFITIQKDIFQTSSTLKSQIDSYKKSKEAQSMEHKNNGLVIQKDS
ncbi:type IVB secretion system protein IcmH/DotU [Helicobacter kayseriensis]|uniref:type IVB secretion system protein IcmH/DotU n=1 Tax=Helicobacter kayseriensis TaxID=2905877 RepID=UPI001E52FA11|nr:type IVB secretion system protein IcmH/DotU [Helicobacter kayseriensis]MCE3047615.1 type IVB secretion system protein IcmH/DotU [Helicobacter kayseriensis]MCE3049033.1 type IVB secretion system protein IcmH/DotU [Helicobacter kayseriensis]